MPMMLDGIGIAGIAIMVVVTGFVLWKMFASKKNPPNDEEKSAMKDKETYCEEKISMEKELNKLKKRLEKSELDLTMAKSLQTSGGSDQNGGEAFFQDVMGNLQDFLDNQLQCTICSEVYVAATVINCGHTFCEECIEVWKTKQSNCSTCPICRKEIIRTSTNQALDAFIERFIDNFYPEAAKVTRTELVSERTAKKEEDDDPTALNLRSRKVNRE